MKKIILLLIITHCSLLITYAQFGWYQQYSGTTNNLNSICFKGSVGWIAGNNGTILKTTNTGTTWFLQSSGTTNNLLSISFYDALTGCTVGSVGTILKTTNGGDNWISLNSGVSINLNSVMLPANNLYLYAVGDFGTVLRSSNNGVNWSVIPSATSNHLKDLLEYNAFLLAVGSNGTVIRSTNWGANWSLINIGTSNDLNSIEGYGYSFDDYLVGNNGKIFKTTDNGLSWTSINSGTSNNLFSITLYPNSYVWVAGAGGLILRSGDGGNVWVQEASGTSNNLNSIFFINLNAGWSVGNNGLILHTYSDLWTALDAKSINANTINAWFRNNGNFNRDPNTGNAGFEWPKGSNKFARYASGPYIGAKVGNDTLVTVAEYDYEYLPGYTDANGNPYGKDDYQYLMYKLSYGLNDSNRVRWPNALLGNSNQGARVYYDDQSHTWKPFDYADQTMFYCYTDSYPESHHVGSGSTAPLKADIKQINFAFDEPGEIGNIIYSYFTLINKNTLPWVNTYFTIWADDDIGIATDDLVGCDTLLDMGYTYNGTNHDGVYGDAPPAVAFDFIKGPAVYTANNNDTAVICYGKTRKVKIGYKQLGMSVFNWYYNGWDPRYYAETYRYMSGLHRDGTPIINPVSGLQTKYCYSGDPVTSTGWIQQGPNDQRFLMSVGPFNMNSGDTQTIVVAQIIARGTSNLNSIAVLRQYTQIARDNYKNCFANVPIGIANLSNDVPIKFSLEQNYPNPFNPITKIRFSVPLNKGGLRGLSVKLTIYDILGREVAIPVNQEMKPGRYEVEWDGSNFASSVYFYKLEAGDFVVTKKMVLLK